VGEWDLARSWIEKAREDLASAEALSRAGPHCAAAAVFHCQQAAEKALKSYLASCRAPIRRTHDLSALLDAAAELRPELEDLRIACAGLAPYAVAYRYPGAPATPDVDEVAQALADARTVTDRVLEHLRVDLSGPG